MTDLTRDTFNVFFPLHKVEEQPDGTCLVYADYPADIPDRVGEIMDYATSKPEILKYSQDAFQRTNGLSYGAVRAMHGKQAAGKMNAPIACDDQNKKFGLVGKVVDPVDVRKCKEGVYAGFSIGGAYKNRWPDLSHPGMYRYTPDVTEFSLVDVPSNPTATFRMVKLDGSSELRKFAGAIVLDIEAEEPRAHDDPQGLTDMQIEAQPDGPTPAIVPPVQTVTGELAIVGGQPVPPNPLQHGIAPVVIEGQGTPPVDMEKATELMNAIASKLDRYAEAVENASAMRKADVEKEEKAVGLLKALGSRVGIARRDGEPLTAPQGLPADASAYGDPANYAWPLDNVAQCTSAIAKFRSGESKTKYSEREWHLLGRRIAHKAATLTSVKWRYDPRAKLIKAEVKMVDQLKKDAQSSIAQDLRAVAQSAIDNISDPQAVMAALHQILAGIDVASDVDDISTPSGSTAASTLEAAAWPTHTTPGTATTGTTVTTPSATTGGSSSEETKTMMAKFDALAESQKNLQDMFTKFLDSQKPVAPAQTVQKTTTIGDLNALVQRPDENATPLEKAIVSVAQRVADGLGSGDVQLVMQAANGDAGSAQDKAMELARRSLAQRGITASARTRVADGMENR